MVLNLRGVRKVGGLAHEREDSIQDVVAEGLQDRRSVPLGGNAKEVAEALGDREVVDGLLLAVLPKEGGDELGELDVEGGGGHDHGHGAYGLDGRQAHPLLLGGEPVGEDELVACEGLLGEGGDVHGVGGVGDLVGEDGVAELPQRARKDPAEVVHLDGGQDGQDAGKDLRQQGDDANGVGGGHVAKGLDDKEVGDDSGAEEFEQGGGDLVWEPHGEVYEEDGGLALPVGVDFFVFGHFVEGLDDEGAC